jgi:hypothetical protein
MPRVLGILFVCGILGVQAPTAELWWDCSAIDWPTVTSKTLRWCYAGFIGCIKKLLGPPVDILTWTCPLAQQSDPIPLVFCYTKYL